ncbi:carboxypeptidase C (cathepsin A) [Oxalobacteraceae bacterium GrIS 1.18]
MKPLQSLAVALLLVCAASQELLAADAAKPDEKLPEAKVWVSKHQTAIGATTVAYTATAGTMLIKNEKDESIALFGFTAYVKDGGEQRTRPIVFAYNGGPGSSSAWLHMGIMGPKRTELIDTDVNSKGPFKSVDNEFSIIDRADLVMIDPIGTGFSRPTGKGEGKDFWGVDQDIKSVSDFIVKYITQNGRWASPKFVLGESYGGMRTAGVSYELLSRYNMSLNGIILVSPYMDFAGGSAGVKIDTPYINFLSTFASTAWYHHALANRPEQLQPFLREVEAFARNVYAPVLLKGSHATAAERQTVLEGLSRYTGISADYWDKADLRMDEGHFLQELMRNKGVLIGRIDTRYTGATIKPLSETMTYDPYSAAIAPAIVATFQDYYHHELKVDSDREYKFSSSDASKEWDDRHVQPDSGGSKVPSPNTGVDLAYAMNMNPKMKVLIDTGYFDLACPYGTVEYAVDHLDIPANLRNNIALEYYEAGHMMYVHPASMQKFKKTLAGFIDANSH